MTALIQENVKRYSKIGNPADMHWFDISDVIQEQRIEDGYTPRDWLMTSRPPFKDCVLVARAVKGEKTYNMVTFLHGDNPETGISVMMLVMADHSNWKSEPGIVYFCRNGQLEVGPIDKNSATTKDDWKMTLNCVALFYKSLAARDCEATLVAVKSGPTSERLIRKGKPPLYQFKTVIVQQRSRKNGAADGTHASPRLHDRRGHIRKLRNGKTVWVRAHKVGNPLLGVVEHNYEVRAQGAA